MDVMAELLALVAPPSCAACRAAIAGAHGDLCSPCRRTLPWLRAECCPRCGLPGHDRERCRAGGGLTRAWAPMAYEGVARELVGELKFRGRLPLARLMAAQLAANLPGDLRGSGAVIVPVPAHQGRRRRRGHDPVDAIASGFARRTGLTMRRCLRRTDASGPQREASQRTRTETGRLAIETIGARAPDRVLLVDDVHTTGATFAACAAALQSAGATWVAGVAYARAL